MERMFGFERTFLERLRLASRVILELAEDDAIPDALAAELVIFKARLERDLLQSDGPSPQIVPNGQAVSPAKGAKCLPAQPCP
jgi:hypothetical protein